MDSKEKTLEQARKALLALTWRMFGFMSQEELFKSSEMRAAHAAIMAINRELEDARAPD
jgi:hypothetical protein